MSRVTIHTRKPLVKAKLFAVEELGVSYSGQQDVFHGITTKPVVYVLPLTEDNELYLTKQYRHLYDKEFTELVSGIVEDGELPLNAAKRELEEEIGIVASSIKQIATLEYASSFISGGPLFYFVAKNLKTTRQNLDPSEEIAIVKIPLDEAVNKIIKGEIVKQSTITGILLLNTLLQKGKYDVTYN